MAIIDFSSPPGDSSVLWTCLMVYYLFGFLAIIIFFWHQERYHLLFASQALSPSFVIMTAVTFFWPCEHNHGVLYCWLCGCTSPSNNTSYLASPPCLSKRYHHLFGLTAVPLRQYQMGQSSSSSAPSGSWQAVWMPILPESLPPLLRNLLANQPVLSDPNPVSLLPFSGFSR
jgi:hypothetical protein